VIPIRDRPELLRRCIASIRAKTRLPDHELVIVDNGSTDPDVARYCRELATSADVRVVAAPGAFNFARLCNTGAAAATGRVLVFLNNDTQIVDAGWLDELCSLAIRPGTGAVGPLLTYEDGTVQSAGVLLGVNRVATSALAGFAVASAAAREWCSSRRRVSAVVGACLAVERAKYLAAGGMDEQFAVSHNEVDLCLRLEARGLANVFTPFVRVIHVEGASRGYDLLPAERRLLEDEERRFLRRWGDVAARCDPARSPNLRREGNTLALDFGSAPARPRTGWRDA
jgi:GT2 family glycosyltransferase